MTFDHVLTATEMAEMQRKFTAKTKARSDALVAKMFALFPPEDMPTSIYDNDQARRRQDMDDNA